MKFKTMLTVAGAVVATGVILNYATNGAVVDAMASVKDRVMHKAETVTEAAVENATEAIESVEGFADI